MAAQNNPDLTQSIAAVRAMADAGTLQAALDVLRQQTDPPTAGGMTDATRRPPAEDWHFVADGEDQTAASAARAKARPSPPASNASSSARAPTTGRQQGTGQDTTTTRVRAPQAAPTTPAPTTQTGTTTATPAEDTRISDYYAVFEPEDPSVPLPAGLQTVAEWGQTVCTLPKLMYLDSTYLELVRRTDAVTVNYMRWILAHCKPASRYSASFRDLQSYMVRAGVKYVTMPLPNTDTVQARTVRTPAAGEQMPYHT